MWPVISLGMIEKIYMIRIEVILFNKVKKFLMTNSILILFV